MCSYCGCDSIEVIGRFMAEHVEVINAAGELRAAVHTGDAVAVAAAKEHAASLLWPHTEAEESGLFSVMATQDEFAEHIAILCGEHVTLAAQLAAITPGDDAAMGAFEDTLREHIDKEDNGLFPAAAIALGGADWEDVLRRTPRVGEAGGAGADRHHPGAGHGHGPAHGHHDPTPAGSHGHVDDSAHALAHALGQPHTHA